MAAVVARFGGMVVIEIANPDPLQRTDGKPRDLVAAHHHERAQHRQDHKRERSRTRGPGLDMTRRNAGLNHHQRKLADLRQIDRRQQAGAQALLHQVKRRERRHHAADHRECRDHQREPDHRHVRDRDRHAQGDEEQRDEEIAQRRDLGGDVERIGKCRQRHAGHQRSHFT